MMDFGTTVLRQQALQSFELGDFESALELGEQALRQNRRDAEIVFMLGRASRALRRYDLAQSYLTKCQGLAPREPAVLTEFGMLRFSQGSFTEAMAMYNKALKITPDFIPAISSKAGLLEHQGQYQRARELLEPLRAAGRIDDAAAVVYARILHEAGQFQQVIDFVAPFLQSPSTLPLNRLHLLDSTAKAYERLGDPDRAFDAYMASKSIQSQPFDAAGYVRDVDALITTFSPTRFPSMPRSTISSELPVFIASMPRSGSTLVEQVLAAHPQVYGAGEIEQFEQRVNSMPEMLDSVLPYPQCMVELTTASATKLGQAYLRDLSACAGSAKRVINKHLNNWRHLGLIALLFPRGKIIHVKRDPLDNCFSCFTTPVLYPYSSDLGHLGLAYRQYERLMTHWRDALGIPMLEVQYEDLVAEPEQWMRRIIDYVGLPWHERCLRFYEFDRPVMTLSYDQVRKPIYKTSLRRCDRFMHRLGPLREALGL